MATTTYSIKLNGAEVATKTKKASAVAAADSLKGQGHVTVETQNGAVVHEVAAPKTGHFKPWTRTETTTKFETQQIPGFTLAYVRNRVQAGVYRANDKTGWMVVQGEDQFPAATTAIACEITNDLAAARKAAKAAKA